jgi:hypothetical protein
MIPFPIARLFAVAPVAFLQAGPSTLKIEPLQKTEVISGCGLAVSLSSAKGSEWPQVFGYYSNNEDGFIRVNGQLHRLRMKGFKQTRKNSHASAMGDRTIEIWSDGNVTVELDCKVNALEEEGVSIQGQLIVRVGSSKQSFSVKGSRGC